MATQYRALGQDIRRIYEAEGAGAQGALEAFLLKKWGDFSLDARLAALEELKEHFAGGAGEKPCNGGTRDDEVLSKVFSLLLGRNVSRADLSSTELLERLAVSLNTIFDTLNQLVGVINMTLTGQGVGEKTIRQVIGGQMEGEGQAKSLESYLGQIKQAFLVAQEAFKKAAHSKVDQIVKELNPDAISEGSRKGLKFGPLRKAEFFDIYQERFRKVEKWFESGRFMEDFLREFEKFAQKLSQDTKI